MIITLGHKYYSILFHAISTIDRLDTALTVNGQNQSTFESDMIEGIAGRSRILGLFIGSGRSATNLSL